MQTSDRIAGLIGLALALVLCVDSACAQTTSAPEQPVAQRSDDHDAEARALFVAGEASFDAGRFDDALRDFERSYELSGRSALLYNIAQAADRGRLDDVALDAFRRYLAASPEAPSRVQIEGRIRVLEQTIARAHETAAAPIATPTMEVPSAPPLPSAVAPIQRAPESGPGLDVGALVLASGGGLLGIAGAILVGVGAPDTGAATSPHAGESYGAAHGRQDLGVELVWAGGVGIAAGIGLLIAGLAVLFETGAADRVHATADGFQLTF